MELVFFNQAFNDDILKWFVIGCNSIAILVWIVTLITKNFSQMDRLWPLLPMVYSWLFLYTSLNYNPSTPRGQKLKTAIVKASDSASLRLIILTSLITLWGMRLAFVFWKRGYYSAGHEDHRWNFIKNKYSWLTLHIFNFIFMGFVQNYILFGYTLPLWRIQTNQQDPLNTFDYVLIGLFLFFFAIEALSDVMQQNFQNRKHDWLKNKNSNKYSKEEIEDFKRGFYVGGFFKYSRHPNYFGDMLLWWTVYLFSLSAQYSTLRSNFHWTSLINYSMFAALFMTYLFQRSVRVTEAISSSKYPEYKIYRQKVNCIFPSFTGYVPQKIKE